MESLHLMTRPAGRQAGHPAAGFTLVELTVVLLLISMAMAMALPRLITPPEKKLEWAAQQLVRDIELTRTRALATRKRSRLTFDVDGQKYAAYLDHDRDGAFSEDAAEASAFMGFGTQKLNEDVRLDRGTAGPAPGDIPGTDPVTFASTRIEFDSKGIPTPLGTSGFIYLAHLADPGKVAAIRVSPAASIQMWMHIDGAWQ